MIKKIFNIFSRKKKDGVEKFKVRVLPFDRNRTHYYIQYKLPNSSWETYNIGFFTYNFDLWNMRHPYLNSDFEQAVEFAKTLTEEKILENNKIVLDRYLKGKIAYEKEIESRNKVWQSE